MKTFFLTCCYCAVVWVTFPAWAIEWNMHGSLKNETAYFISGENRFDKVQNRLELKPEAILSQRWEFRGRMLAWYDAAMVIESTNNTDLSKGIKRHYRTYLASKEAYLLYGADDFDFRIGQQQVVWGKTDGLRMLDIINPLDTREFILDDFLDSRIGLLAARLNYYAYLNGGEHEFELIIIPDAKVMKRAPIGSRWAFSLPSVPIGVSPVFQDGEEPAWAAKNTEYGMAWRANLGGWDLSLNWFYGWKDTPNIEKQLSAGKLFLKPVYLQMHTLGGSFSNAFGAAILRGEVAVNINEGIDMSGVTALTSVAKKTTINAAMGIDYTKRNWMMSPQVFIRYISGWDKNTVEDRLSGFVSLRIATDFINEKLKPEVLGLFDWANSSWMLRPKVEYVFNDQLTGTVGLDVFGGKQGSFFGQFSDNDRVYFEMMYSF
ncbi:MAG: DUF1302 family protein [Mariprofundaceae bacterium]